MTISIEADKKQREGWQEEKHYHQRVYHYIFDGFSLCGKLGFYNGRLMPFKGTKGKEDCAECFRRAEKRFKKAQRGQDEHND